MYPRRLAPRSSAWLVACKRPVSLGCRVPTIIMLSTLGFYIGNCCQYHSSHSYHDSGLGQVLISWVLGPAGSPVLYDQDGQSQALDALLVEASLGPK